MCRKCRPMWVKNAEEEREWQEQSQYPKIVGRDCCHSWMCRIRARINRALFKMRQEMKADY